MATGVEGQLPEWAVYAFAAGGGLFGILITFLLGIVGHRLLERRGAGHVSQYINGGARRDCDNCPSIRRVDAGLNKLNERIDALLLEMAKHNKKEGP